MDDSIPQKRCPKCKQEWPATPEYFYRRPNRPGGLCYKCKACMQTEHALKHPPNPKEQLPEGYKHCTQCLTILPATTEFFYPSKKYGMDWCCKVCAIERAGAYSRARRKFPPVHTVLAPSGFRICTTCHDMKPATLEYFRYRPRPDGLDTKCKTCKSEERKRYFREHAEQRTKNAIRLRRYQNIPGTLTSQQIQDKLQKQHYRCYYCNSKFEKMNKGYTFHLDHIIPISRSEHNPRHDINNVVLACHACNESKHNRLPHEWPKGGRLL